MDLDDDAILGPPPDYWKVMGKTPPSSDTKDVPHQPPPSKLTASQGPAPKAAAPPMKLTMSQGPAKRPVGPAQNPPPPSAQQAPVHHPPPPSPSLTHTPPPPPVVTPAPEVKYRALYNYQSKGIVGKSGDVDLSFAKGDLMTLVKDLQNGWLRVKIGQNMGVVPANYVKEEKA
jgi:hypothetical protein